MDIADIDKNLTVYADIPEDIEWFDIRKAPFIIYGLLDCGNEFRRLPKELTDGISESLTTLSQNTAGGRVRFKTDSPYIAIKAGYNEVTRMSHMAFINNAGFDVYSNTASTSRYLGSLIAPWDLKTSFANIIYTDGGLHDLTINFPSYGSPVTVLIGLKKGSRLENTDGYCSKKPIIFYGSSITQGGCASRPGLVYENYISRHFNIDYINLGFSGNGLAEEAVVDYMAGLDFGVFVSDYDHNAPDLPYLEKTHYRMYEKIRAAHPDVPYIMLSKPDFDADVKASAARRDVIYDSYRRAKQNDENVYFIDGQRLFGEQNRDNCTVDGCHPNDLGMYRMAEVLIGELDKIL